MKYLCFFILFFCVNCSPHKNVVDGLYKVHQNCLTEQNVLTISNAYLINVKKIGIDIKDYNVEITDLENSYYLLYSPKYTGIFRGGGYSIIINKNNCDVIYFKPEV